MTASEIVDPKLSGLAQTLVIPLNLRALESQRPDALLRDNKAVSLIEQIDNEWFPFNTPEPHLAHMI
jgi:O-methyltransferase involved in polyketide biosynthesis